MELKPPSPKSEILKPLLYLSCAFTGSAAIATFAQTTASVILLGCGIFFALNMLVAYWICFVYHPERLQSEDYQKHLLGDNVKGAPASESAPVTANTAEPVSILTGTEIPEALP